MSFGKYLIPAIIPRRVAPDSSVLSVPADPQRAGSGVQTDHRTGGIDQQLQGIDLSLDAVRQRFRDRQPVAVKDSDVQVFPVFKMVKEFAVKHIHQGVIRAHQTDRFNQVGENIQRDYRLDPEKCACPPGDRSNAPAFPLPAGIRTQVGE